MKQRGRKQNIDAQVIVGDFGKRPEPPADLTERQAEIWRGIVASEREEFFKTGALRGLLRDLVCHREASEKIGQVINDFNSDWLSSDDGAKRYKDLLKMREVETRAAANLATKLRLTNQARYTPQAAATAASRPSREARPWEK